MRRVIAIGLLCCGLGVGIAGCADPNTKATHIGFGTTTDTVTTGPALRLVTERQRPLGDGQWLPTMCSEPSPDAAIAFGRSFSGQGNYSETGGPTVGGTVTAASTEAATQLNGRTAGVLALRDGLYAACQSYVNGVLGHDAYAMILSQYGNLLVALAGTGTAGNPVAFTSQDAAVSAMLVACISEHDPTRIRPHLESIKYPGSYTYDLNPLLSEKRCKNLLDRIAQGRLLAPQKKAAAPAANKTAEKPGAGVKITSMTKTVTEKSGAPFAPVTASGAAAKQ